MLQLTVARRSVVGAAVASALHLGYTSKRQNSSGAYYTVRPRTMPPVPTPSEARVKEFKRFYETVTRSREATSLPPTPLGYGGSERIVNNELLHESPWQASCVELRERAAEPEKKVMSYNNIDFASLRRQTRRNRAAAAAAAPGSAAPPHRTSSSASGSYSNVEDMRPKSNGQTCAEQPGPGLDVVHYYETSTAEGLAGYQHIAVLVRKGQLPGSCTNFSAEGGFAVWVVPHDEYVEALSAVGRLPT
ncbi:hypothetical protein NESM_000736800 [Novymonas esmeraldas]|uniref:Uncharacterized protein n=1 Tax=Novymonas esmeraldas TaxID=1808958 RepID=A0AAW0EVL8_9TRYP